MSDETDNSANDSEDDSEAAMVERMTARLMELRTEHRRIDTEIEAARELGVVDVLKIQRMKKIKLAMRDQIVWLENKLTPDIIA